MYGYIIVIILIITVWYQAHQCEEYMYGFWVATDDFCAEADISTMLLFIGRPTGWISRARQCYIVISDDIYNGAVSLSYLPSLPFPGRYCIKASIDAEPGLGWPKDVYLCADSFRGTLDITGPDGTVYALMCKQHDITNTATQMDAAEL